MGFWGPSDGLRCVSDWFFFAETKQQIAKRFPNLYDEPDPKHLKAGYNELIKPYGWFSTFVNLAGEDVTKLESINKIKLYQAMAFLSQQNAKAQFMQNLQIKQ